MENSEADYITVRAGLISISVVARQTRSRARPTEHKVISRHAHCGPFIVLPKLVLRFLFTLKAEIHSSPRQNISGYEKSLENENSSHLLKRNQSQLVEVFKQDNVT
jgi:hypothetical protein